MRILHTADWQLGMTRHFLDEEAQARFSAARNDAIRAMGELAAEEDAACIVVAGDVFDSNHVDRRTVVRALDAMGASEVPFYLLPGNHDPLSPASVYTTETFEDHRPSNVHVLEEEPVEPEPGLELVGALWSSKRPYEDLANRRLAELEPDPGVHRVLVAHGGVDALSPDPDDPSLIDLDGLEAAVGDGRVDYVALGDRHSTTEVGAQGRVWYAGAPEPTAYDEEDAGNVLLVAFDNGVEVEPRGVGRWRFIEREFSLDGEDDLQRLETWLEDREDRSRTLLKLSFVGTVNLRQKARLDDLIDHARDVYAAVEIWDRHTDLAILPDDADASDLELSGFASATLDRLEAQAKGEGEQAQVASDALGLLYRLAGGEAR